MGKREELASILFNGVTPVQVYPATVKSVEGETCTVLVNHADLEVTGVRLQADPVAGLLLTPSVNSIVLIGCIENDLGNLFVCQYSQLEKAEIKIDNTSIIYIDKEKAELKRGNVKVSLGQSQLAITNGQESLKSLFSDLVSLLQTFIVLTAQGPSSGLDPGTITKLTQLTTKLNQVFSE